MLFTYKKKKWLGFHIQMVSPPDITGVISTENLFEKMYMGKGWPILFKVT